MKLGIYGGTFNPPHLGHLAAARFALEALELDELRFVPAAAPPHKALPDRSPAPEARLAMTELAADSLLLPDKVGVSGMELARPGKSYTADTLRQLRAQYPEARLWLLMGADMFLTLHQWREPEVIASLAGLCTFARAASDSLEALDAQASLGLSSASVAGTSGAGVSVVRTGTNEILFQFDSTQGLYLAVNPGQSDREEAQTHFRGSLYFGAFEYRRSGGDITVVNVLSMDDYIQGVILQEMSASWPLEALKAQAVCARSYAWGTLQASKHQGDGFDLCNAVHCQAYKGVAEMSDNSRRAVEETSGEYLWYNGQVAEQAVYSSHNGGARERRQRLGQRLPLSDRQNRPL